MTTVDSIVVERKPGPSGWVYEVRIKGIDRENFGLECWEDSPLFEARAGTTLKIIFDEKDDLGNVLQFPRQYGDVGIGKTNASDWMEASS